MLTRLFTISLPTPVTIGIAFFMIWTGAVIVSALIAWFANRLRLLPRQEKVADYAKAIGAFMLLGLFSSIGMSIASALLAVFRRTAGERVVLLTSFAVVGLLVSVVAVAKWRGAV